jgi:hypothetical protein
MIAGAGVILFDPIFQGLAISLMAGEVASLMLSRMAVPVLYYMAKRHERTDGGRVMTGRRRIPNCAAIRLPERAALPLITVRPEPASMGRGF